VERKSGRVPGAGNSCRAVYPCRGGNGSLESLGTINRNCDLCLERICHHFFVATRSETQSYGAEFLCSLGASGYLVPSAYGQTSIPSARCGATQPAAKSWVVTVHQVVLGDSTALLHASRLANIRDRYDPTVPAYVLRHRRTCGIFNPNANPRFVRLLRIIKYLAVARSLVSCCKYLLFPLCHGNDLRLPPQLRENVDIRQTPGYMSSF